MSSSQVRKRNVASHPVADLTFDASRPTPKKKVAFPPQRGVSPKLALALLVTARLISAAINIIHDCDETYNFWEPLHYLFYGTGMQTWEYSAGFALRPYIYLLLHALVGGPVALVVGKGAAKVAVFYAIRAALALASAYSEWMLYRAVQRRYNVVMANSFLVLLCITTGMFASSTGFLPSSFTMYAVTAAAAGVLEGRQYYVIVVAAIGLLWGWIVAGVAFIPYALWVLATANFVGAVGMGLLALAGTLGPLVLVDRFFYDKWTVSLFNFLNYNVGHGDSHLYGVEGPTYYLRNAFNQFSLALPLALALPVLALLAGGRLPLSLNNGSNKEKRAANRKATLQLLVCLSPVATWLGAITALPHKEERFLFVVYPLICLAAAASLAALTNWATSLLSRPFSLSFARSLARLGANCLLAVVGLLALSRTTALLLNYGAPMTIYRHLPQGPSNGTLQHVCVGAEWYRFPGAFFLPGRQYRLQFVKSGFTGHLPRPFDPAQGGTAAAPPQLNDRNREEPENYWASPANCDYLVTLLEGPEEVDNLGGLKWDVVASLPFVDQARSPPLARAFYIPGYSAKRNQYVKYALLEQLRDPN